MKNVLVISSSLRKDSNSEALAKALAKGAEAAGNHVEVISLRGKDIGFCRGCMACQRTQRCILKDDAPALVEKVGKADVLVFATPIYYYEMSGLMKTFLDRCNPLFPSDYAFRQVYLVATAADSGKSAMDGAVTGISGWVSCFEKASLAGVIRGTSLYEPGAAKKAEAILQEAYDMGAAIR